MEEEGSAEKESLYRERIKGKSKKIKENVGK